MYVCVHMCLCMPVCACLIVRECRSLGWVLQSATFTPFQKTEGEPEKERRGGAALKLVFRSYKGVWYIWVYVKRRQMWSDRPLSAACSVLWQRERAKIHPAPGRQSLWQPLLWWQQGCTWSDGGHGTLGDSPNGAVRGDTHTDTHTNFKKRDNLGWNSGREWHQAILVLLVTLSRLYFNTAHMQQCIVSWKQFLNILVWNWVLESWI